MGDGFQVSLVCCTQVICNEIAQGISRKSVALTYAMAITSEARSADAPVWGEINRAIVKKWGTRGLAAVKNRAWKIVEGKIQP